MSAAWTIDGQLAGQPLTLPPANYYNRFGRVPAMMALLRSLQTQLDTRPAINLAGPHPCPGGVFPSEQRRGRFARRTVLYADLNRAIRLNNPLLISAILYNALVGHLLGWPTGALCNTNLPCWSLSTFMWKVLRRDDLIQFQDWTIRLTFWHSDFPALCRLMGRRPAAP